MLLANRLDQVEWSQMTLVRRDSKKGVHFEDSVYSGKLRMSMEVEKWYHSQHDRLYTRLWKSRWDVPAISVAVESEQSID